MNRVLNRTTNDVEIGKIRMNKGEEWTVVKLEFKGSLRGEYEKSDTFRSQKGEI